MRAFAVRAANVARRHPHLIRAQPVREPPRHPARRHGVTTPCRDEPRQVRLLGPVRVREHELADAEPPQKFRQHRPRTPEPHDSHAGALQKFLTSIAEQPALPVVHPDCGGLRRRPREQQLPPMADDRGFPKRRTASAGEPQVSGHCRPCEHQRPHGHTPPDVEQRRIATFVRRHVRS